MFLPPSQRNLALFTEVVNFSYNWWAEPIILVSRVSFLSMDRPESEVAYKNKRKQLVWLREEGARDRKLSDRLTSCQFMTLLLYRSYTILDSANIITTELVDTKRPLIGLQDLITNNDWCTTVGYEKCEVNWNANNKRYDLSQVIGCAEGFRLENLWEGAITCFA